MLIREFQAQDQAAIINLWHACGLVAKQNNPISDIHRKLQVDPNLFLVGELKGELIGSVMCGYEGHRGWVNYLAIKPALQGSGYGRQLMECLEKKLRQRGCAKINLQVRSSNRVAIDFYRRLGYLDDDVVSLGKRLHQDD